MATNKRRPEVVSAIRPVDDGRYVEIQRARDARRGIGRNGVIEAVPNGQNLCGDTTSAEESKTFAERYHLIDPERVRWALFPERQATNGTGEIYGPGDPGAFFEPELAMLSLMREGPASGTAIEAPVSTRHPERR